MDSIASYSSERWTLHHGDALDVLRGMPARSCDVMATDPPAGIGFMGRAWDGDLGGRAEWVAAHAAIFGECRRVLVPGAHAIVWALPRTSHWTATALEDAGLEVRDVAVHLQAQGWPKSRALLKPAAEHWILCRAPGPLRELGIDAARVGAPAKFPARGAPGTGYSASTGNESVPPNTLGRWPANVTLEHASECCDECSADCPVAVLDLQSGARRSGDARLLRASGVTGATFGQATARTKHYRPAESGGASRFYFCSKARFGAREGSHPTVKPVELMRWLCRLVAPTGGLVLDPFAGSGTTGVAALAEGLRFVGIEREVEHIETARRRLDEATRQTTLPLAGGAA